MILKVEIGDKKESYSFNNKNVISIGRSTSCDIQITADGVSRSHLEVRQGASGPKVIDLGSTNGSFINGERLAPNQEHSFNSFFPVKLGHLVSVYLVDNEESQEVGEFYSPESSINSVNNGVTNSSSVTHRSSEEKTQIQTRIQTQKNYKINKSKPSKTNSNEGQFKIKVIATIVFILGFFVYNNQEKFLNLMSLNNDFKQSLKPPVSSNVQKVKKPSRTIAAKKNNAINSKQASLQNILNLAKKSLSIDKCLSNEVAGICDALKKAKSRNYYEGAVVIDNTLHIVIDLKASFVHFQKNAPLYNAKEQQNVLNLLLSNPRYRGDITNRIREKSPINLNDYRPILKDNDYIQYAKSVIYSELLFSKLRESLINSPFDDINIVLYEIKSNQYQYAKHWYINKKILKSMGPKVAELEYSLKLALFNGELDLLNSLDRQVKASVSQN
jgi:hypothetical protein